MTQRESVKLNENVKNTKLEARIDILCKINLAIILYGSVNPHQILHFIF